MNRYVGPHVGPTERAKPLRAPCSVEDCDRPSHARNLCQTHYMRLRRHGDHQVTLIDRNHADICSVDGCDRPYRSLGLCFMHWQRQHLRGDPGSASPEKAHYGPSDACSVDGCNHRPRRNWLCEMRADRLDRTGTVGGPDRLRNHNGSGYIRSDGYTELRQAGTNHPLFRNGRVLLHRLVLWERIGPGPHDCHWCGTRIRWTFGLADDALVGDHVDHDPTNNEPSNIVPSCNLCNSARRK